jgi:hypothetical protein
MNAEFHEKPMGTECGKGRRKTRLLKLIKMTRKL